MFACSLSIIHSDEKTGNQFTYSGMLRDTWKSHYMRIRLERMNHYFFTLDEDKAATLLLEMSPEGRKELRIFTPLQRYDIWKKQGKKDINGIADRGVRAGFRQNAGHGSHACLPLGRVVVVGRLMGWWSENGGQWSGNYGQR